MEGEGGSRPHRAKARDSPALPQLLLQREDTGISKQCCSRKDSTQEPLGWWKTSNKNDKQSTANTKIEKQVAKEVLPPLGVGGPEEQ